MPEPPKAHRRLVPRVTRPVEKPATPPPPAALEDDHDVTAQHSRVEPDESLELTAVREAPLAIGTVDPDPDPDPDDDYDFEATSQHQRAPVSVSDDDAELDEDDVITADPDDAGETMAIPTRAATEPPEGPPARDSDLEIEVRRDFPIPSYAMTAAKEAVPKFGPTWSTLAGDNPRSTPLPKASQSLVPVAQVQSSAEILLPDPSAFSELEPTNLKAPIHTDSVEARPTTHISPAERGLLAAMSEGHEASRKIYMQWLERRGETIRAEYLKLEIQLAAMNPLDIRFQETQDQLREIAQKISVDWRSRVARSLIENCRGAGCPTYWRALPADGDDVRTCGSCHSQVFYCVTIELARGRVKAGQRVALDVTVERAPDDLTEPRCAGCQAQLPNHTRFCPHCGRQTMI